MNSNRYRVRMRPTTTEIVLEIVADWAGEASKRAKEMAMPTSPLVVTSIRKMKAV